MSSSFVTHHALTTSACLRLELHPSLKRTIHWPLCALRPHSSYQPCVHSCLPACLCDDASPNSFPLPPLPPLLALPRLPSPLCPSDFDAALQAVESEFSAADQELGSTRKQAEEAAAAMKELEHRDTKVPGGGRTGRAAAHWTEHVTCSVLSCCVSCRGGR